MGSCQRNSCPQGEGLEEKGNSVGWDKKYVLGSVTCGLPPNYFAGLQ